MKNYDVVIVGGGLSGVCASIAAARGGAKVLLAEKGNCLGGAATNALVNPFMPYTTKINGYTIELNAGIFLEILRNLNRFNAVTSGYIKTFNEEFLKLVLNRMVIEAGVKLLYHAYFTGVSVEGNEIKSVQFATKGGNLVFGAKCFIDTTGDADLAYNAGCPTRLGREEDSLCQPMTMCFRLGNVDTKAFNKEFASVNRLYKKYQAMGKIKNPRENVLKFKTMNEGVLHLNSTRICKRNPVDAFDLTTAELEVREQVYELYCFLKDNFKSCKDAELLMTSSEIGVRESRMIDGEYVLTGEDLVSCKKFDDSIAVGNYDIDIHNPEGSGTSHYLFEDGTYYTIPYRCLLPKNITNLLVAGRCSSYSHEAQASCRVMPICTSVGQAAGTAAAIAVKENVKLAEVNIEKLQKQLKKDNAFI